MPCLHPASWGRLKYPDVAVGHGDCFLHFDRSFHSIIKCIDRYCNQHVRVELTPAALCGIMQL